MMKRILSVILAVCMLGSLAVVVASAEEQPEKTYKYVALGDSIAAGYGLYDGDLGKDPALVLSEELIANPVQDAYAQVFGRYLAELGAEYGVATTATNLSTTAYRAQDVAKTITTPGFKGEVATSILEGFVGPGTSEVLVPYHDIFNNYLPEADMISIQLGANDIIMGIIVPINSYDNPILKDVGLAVTLLLFGLEPEQAIGYGIQQIMNDKDKITKDHIVEATKVFADIIKNRDQYVLNAAEQVEGVVEAVEGVNPTADIALVGMFNPYGNSLVYDGQVRDICHVVQNIFVRCVSEALDCEVTVDEEPDTITFDEPQDVAEELDNVADEISNTPMTDCFKAKLQSLVTIVAEEIAYPVQYFTAGKAADPQMKLLNEKVQDIALRHGATYVNVYDITNECNTDPHPDAQHHKEIADRLGAAMTDKIVSRMNPEFEPELNIESATLIQQYIAEFDIKHIDFKAADFNGDGKVDINDVTAMQRVLAELV